MSYNAFISYSSKDANMAGDICNLLEEQGFRCWIAPRNIDTGAPFAKAIIDGIKGSEHILLIYSRHSIISEQVLREVDRAVHFGVKLLVFKTDNSKCPDSLDYYLCKSKTIDAVRGNYHQYIKEIAKNIGTKKASPSDKVQKVRVETVSKPKTIKKTKKKKAGLDIKSYAIGFTLVSLILAIVLVTKKINQIPEKKTVPKKHHEVVKDFVGEENFRDEMKMPAKLRADYYKKANTDLFNREYLSKLTKEELLRLKDQVKGQGGDFFRNTRAGLVKVELSAMAKKNLEIIEECLAKK